MDFNAVFEPVMGSIANYYQGLSTMAHPPCQGAAQDCAAQGHASPGGMIFPMLLALLPIALPIAISSKLF